jgi:hypothetical protein
LRPRGQRGGAERQQDQNAQASQWGGHRQK